MSGGAGFIGAALVHALCRAGIPVTVIDRLPRAKADRLAALDDDQLRYHAVTLDDAELLQPIVEGHTTIVHLAANVENRADRAGPDADLVHTVKGTATLLRAVADLPEATIVLASSQLVYAPSAGDRRITETNGVIAPSTSFAAGKAAAEAFLHAHCRQHGHHGAVCRLSNVVGPGMRRGIIPDLVRSVLTDPERLQVLGDGRQTRSYLHIDDCVAALLVAATSTSPFAIYNVCNTDDLSAGAVAEIVAQEVPGGPPAIGFTGGETGWRGDTPTLRVWPQALLAAGWTPRKTSRGAVHATVQALMAAKPVPAPPTEPPPRLREAERWEVLGRRPLYDSDWVRLALVNVKPPGRPAYEHHVVELPSAVGIVLRCSERGVLLLHRHRFITDSTGFEIPAGGIDDGESIEDAAARETLEETGWRVGGIERLISCNVSDGVTDQRFHLVLAHPNTYAGPPDDPHEATSRVWTDPNRIRAMIRGGEIPGALSITALLYALSSDLV